MKGTGGKPRVGFLGLGWIGRHRMQGLVEERVVDAVALADPSSDALEEAARIAPAAERCTTLDELLERDLDAVVIATPSAMHAEQTISALERGLAVFCQKPLGREAAETAAMVERARAADRLLGVDLSYRHIEGMEELRSEILGGNLGTIFSIDLLFHNAWGPDGDWFYDRRRSGGGCLIDLGVHLVDLALWALDFPAVTDVQGSLFRDGRPMTLEQEELTEDFASATFRLESGALVRIACSWRLHAGREAVIQAEFHGTNGGGALHNVDGSFYDFDVERYEGTSRRTIASSRGWSWGRAAALEWGKRLAAGEGFDPSIEHQVEVSRILDAVYGREAYVRDGVTA